MLKYQKNLVFVEKQLKDIENDLKIYRKSDDSPIFENIEIIIQALKEEVNSCSTTDQNIENTVNRANKTRKIFERMTTICDGIYNFQLDPNKTNPNLDSCHQLLQKLLQEENSYSSKLLCAQKVSKDQILFKLEHEIIGKKKFFRVPLVEEKKILSAREDAVLFSEVNFHNIFELKILISKVHILQMN